MVHWKKSKRKTCATYWGNVTQAPVFYFAPLTHQSKLTLDVIDRSHALLSRDAFNLEFSNNQSSFSENRELISVCHFLRKTRSNISLSLILRLNGG